MPVTNLAVQYHQQDTDYYCGAACAQMVLESIGAGLLDQGPLYADNHSHSTIEPFWYTGPDGLQWTLNDRRPAGFPGWFALFALSTEDAISRKIVWTIHHYNVAPVPLVFGWAHWIVTRGYDVSAHPADSTDASYTINAFRVNNPWPPTPSFYNPALAPPPPHGGADGCGTGGDRGIANEHISYATWQSTYMTGVPSGYWSGKFVAVCDPDPPPTRYGQLRPAFEARFKGERLLTRDEATEESMVGLEQYGLHKDEEWAEALRDTQPGRPVLVQRLDRLDSYYYLVPMLRNGRISAAVRVDGRFGRYRQAVALPPAARDLEATYVEAAYSPESEPLQRALKGVVELEEPLGRLVLRREAICLSPAMVWKPCRESLSPFYPFFLVTLGAHRIYIRIDGRVFTKLHDDVAGI